VKILNAFCIVIFSTDRLIVGAKMLNVNSYFAKVCRYRKSGVYEET